MNDQLRQLLHIAEAIRDRDFAELANRQAHRRGAALAREDIDAQSRKEADTARSELFYRGRFEPQRQIWLAARMHALTFEEARSAALVEQQKKIAARSFGRAQVLGRMAERDTGDT